MNNLRNCAGVRGWYNMEQFCEMRTRLLLETSADIYNQMAEIWSLREALRTAEATLGVAGPAIVAPSPPNELRA